MLDGDISTIHLPQHPSDMNPWPQVRPPSSVRCHLGTPRKNPCPVRCRLSPVPKNPGPVRCPLFIWVTQKKLFIMIISRPGHYISFHFISRTFLMKSKSCCLLWIEKTRAKDKRYILGLWTQSNLWSLFLVLDLFYVVFINRQARKIVVYYESINEWSQG